jgi:hypothetical protein
VIAVYFDVLFYHFAFVSYKGAKFIFTVSVCLLFNSIFH